MSIITRFALKLGGVVFLAAALLFGGGILAATQLQQDLLPSISFPAFIVITPYPGASPQVVDDQVTVPVVNSMSGVNGVDTVQSTSSQGASLVIVLFKDGTDIRIVRQDITAALDKVKPLLPQQALSPTISTFSTSDIPILVYAVSANEPLGTLAGQLRAQALPKLKGLAGVASVAISGAPTDEVDVTLDPAKLAAHGISLGQVTQALQAASAVQSIGSLKQGDTTIPLQVAGSLTSVDQISKITVTPTAAPGGKAPTPVPISQLGTVAQVSVPADTITRTNGTPSIGLQVIKSPDGNTVTVANEVKDALPDIRSRIGNGVQFASISDQATPITDAIGTILREGLLGAVFAVLVIFLFLRSARATVVAAVSIPLSLMVALLVLWWQGITLNILTLGGMMVAIGRVVDDAIVVLENISRHVSEGEPPLVAAYTGAREIVTAVSSSTLTTIAVFLPIAFLTGIAGSFFRPFALTVVVALAASLVVAVTVVPLLASRLLPASKSEGAERRLQYNFIQRVYVPVIRWATSHRLLALLATGVFFAGSMALLPLLRVNLLDQSSSPNFPVSITMPANSTLVQTNAETQRVEELMKGIPGIHAYQAVVGGIADPFAPPGTVPADPTLASVLVLVDTGAYNQALSGVQNALKAYNGPAKIQVGQAQSSSNASSTQMQVDVRAANSADLQTATATVLAALNKVSGLAELKSNLAASKPTYQLTPTDKLTASGLSLLQLAGIIAQEVNGQVAAQVNLPQGTMNVRVQLTPGSADNAAALAATPVPTAQGIVPLGSLVTFQLVNGPQAVDRVNGDRDVTITGTITGNNTRAVQTDVTNALNSVSLPPGASVSTGGVFAQLSNVLTQFALALAAAVALVYLIMVATFRSLLKPLVLLVAIPFAASGAIIALVATGTSLSLPGLIGILMLTGVVVTNAIVLLDLVEQYRDRGLSLQDAIIEGGRHRLRPILMTAFATMLALVPLAVSGSSGGAFISAPLAIVVIGGLFTSTFLTLVLVPVLYSLTARFSGRRSTRDLDNLLDAAEDRRFKVIGLRGSASATPEAPIAATTQTANISYEVSLFLEPEPGITGDPAILTALTQAGLRVEPVANTSRMRVVVPHLEAPSPQQAQEAALTRVHALVPKNGYRLTQSDAVAQPHHNGESALVPAAGGA
ncbi:MAG TPA: efflux RND transporter permease subunit [Candidatus Dormibacteraeota bacterium]